MRMAGVVVLAGMMTAAAGMGWGQAPAAAPAGPAAEVQRGYQTLKANILKAADKMPVDDYQFMPTPDVRTFARVVNHVTEAQFRSCGAVNHTAGPGKPPADTADKAAIVEGLKASFAECDKAFAALTDANLTEMFTLGQGKRSRIGLAWGTVAHDDEQYATMALYLRLKGLVPPSSEK
jgi:DinB superfamily